MAELWIGTARRIAPILLLLGHLTGIGCTSSSDTSRLREPQLDGRPLRIVVTVGMLADVVRAVGGDRVEVHALMNTGVDPHLYKATRDDVLRIRDADIVFYCGLMLEGKMSEVLRKTSQQPWVIAVAEAIPRDQLLSDAGESHPDPHVWMDVRLWQEASREVARVLIAYRPAQEPEIRERLEAWLAHLDRLDAYGQRVLESIEPQKRLLVTSHDAFRYFGRRYGVEVMAVQGISTDSEAGLHRIRELVDIIVARNVAAVFVESSVPQDSIQALVRGAASRGFPVRIGGQLYSDAMGPAGAYEGTYIGMMDHNFTTIARELGGHPPDRGFAGEQP